MNHLDYSFITYYVIFSVIILVRNHRSVFNAAVVFLSAALAAIHAGFPFIIDYRITPILWGCIYVIFTILFFLQNRGDFLVFIIAASSIIILTAVSEFAAFNLNGSNSIAFWISKINILILLALSILPLTYPIHYKTTGPYYKSRNFYSLLLAAVFAVILISGGNGFDLMMKCLFAAAAGTYYLRILTSDRGSHKLSGIYGYVFNSISDAVIITDSSFKIADYNKNLLTLLGYDAGFSLQNMDLSRIFNDSSNGMRDINHILLNNQTNIESSIVRNNGDKITVLINSDPIIDELGSFRGAVCVLRNITDIKLTKDRLAESEQFLKSIVNNISETIYRLSRSDDFTKIDFLSSKIFELTGCSSADFCDGKVKYEDFILEEDLSYFKRVHHEAYLNMNNFSLEYRIVDADENVKWVHETGTMIFNKKKEVIHTDGIIIDITKHKIVERELNRINSILSEKNEELEYIVHIRSLELQSVLTKLARSEEIKSINEIISGLSHELKTPISVCLIALSYLNERNVEIDRLFESDALKKSDYIDFKDIINETVKIVMNNLKHTTALIKSFNHITSDQSNDQIEKINLKSHVDGVMMGLKPVLRQHTHIINNNISPDLNLTTYPGALSQVLINLINNSYLHGFENVRNGIITISAADIEDGCVTITYTDNGNGIAQENIDKVFDMYYTTKKGKGGSGLGLHIVKKLIENTMMGSIKLQSSSGQGVKITITLRDLKNLS